MTFHTLKANNLWISHLHCMRVCVPDVCVYVHLMKQLMVDAKPTVAFEAIWVGWLWQWVAGVSATWNRIKHGYWRWLETAGQACA